MCLFLFAYFCTSSNAKNLRKMIAPPTAIFQSQQTTREFGLRRSSATISIDTRLIKSGRLFALKKCNRNMQ
jgi:hypothetical protein